MVLRPATSCRADSLAVEVAGRNMAELKKDGKVEVSISKHSFTQVIKDKDNYWVNMIRRTGN